MFLNKLSESNDHMKTVQKREYIKVFGKAAAIFEEALVPYVHRIVNTLAKKARDETSELSGVISDTFGQVTYHIVIKAGE
jgi:ABC-type multidrug transport system fused ATPase/permease subunit